MEDTLGGVRGVKALFQAGESSKTYKPELC